MQKITCENLVEGHRMRRSVISAAVLEATAKCGCASPPVPPCAYRELNVLTVGVCRKGDRKENATLFANSASKVVIRGLGPSHTVYALQCCESVQKTFLDLNLKLVHVGGVVLMFPSNPKAAS